MNPLILIGLDGFLGAIARQSGRSRLQRKR
jgi:hypothetical protein